MLSQKGKAQMGDSELDLVVPAVVDLDHLACILSLATFSDPPTRARACMWSTIRTTNSHSPASSHRVEADHHSHSSHQLPPSSAAHREQSSKAASLTASFRSVLHRLPTRAPSSNSLHTTYSAASAKKPAAPIKTPTAQSPDYQPFHPYAAMVAAPLPVVSSHDATEDEEDCPVCLEPLSFSFRLPGEKPHIVPECGHALHEVSISVLFHGPSFSSTLQRTILLQYALGSAPPIPLFGDSPTFASRAIQLRLRALSNHRLHGVPEPCEFAKCHILRLS